MGNDKVDRKNLLVFLEGQRKANELIIEEKKKRFVQLTVEDSLCEYDALCGMWQAWPNKEGLKKLEQERISFLIERKRRFNKVGFGGYK